MTTTCTTCGEQLTGGRFCPECGTPVARNENDRANHSSADGRGPSTWPTAASPTATERPAAPWPAPITPQRSTEGSPGGASPWPAPPQDAKASAPVAASPSPSPSPAPQGEALRWPAWLRPGFAVLLLLLAMFSPWRAVATWWADAPSANASGLTVLTLLLAMGAALLPRLRRSGVGFVQSWPERTVRLALLVPLAVAVLVAVVQHLRQTESMGPGVLLAVSGALVVAGMEARSGELDRWQTAAVVALGLGVLTTLTQVAGMFGNGVFGLFVLLGVVWLWAFAGWYALALVRRNATDWLAMVLVGALLLVAVGISSTVGAGVSGLAPLVLMAGVVMGATEGMHERMGLSTDPARRWNGLAASLLTVWAGAAAYVTLVGVVGLVASGSSASGIAIWLTLLGAGMAVAAVAARRSVLTHTAQGRSNALWIVGAAVVVWFVTILVSEQQLGLSSFFGLILPAAVAAILLLPASVVRDLDEQTARTPHPGPTPDQSTSAPSPGPAANASAAPSSSTAPSSAEPRPTVPAATTSPQASAVDAWVSRAASTPAHEDLGGARPGGLGARFAARLIDGVLLSIVVYGLTALGMLSAVSSVDPYTGMPTGGGMATFALTIILVVAISVLYEIVLIATTGATAGKHVLKLRVTTMDGLTPPGWGPSGRRFLLPAVAGLIPPGSLLVLASALFDDSGQHRGWHDKFADTRVISLN